MEWLRRGVLKYDGERMSNGSAGYESHDKYTFKKMAGLSQDDKNVGFVTHKPRV